MAAASVAFNGIVFETLRYDNYENWSVLLKIYLMGQGLWDVVSASATESKDEDWRKKNAKALHAIHLSCGSSAFARISECVTAEEAWNQLSFLFNSDLNRDIEQGIMDDNFQQLRRHVRDGNWEAANACIDEDPHVVFSACSVGRTILHVAVIAGNEEIVEKLVNEIEILNEREILLKQDTFGYTALALAAKLTDSKRMAECLAGNFNDLLTMQTKDNEIPVLLASANGHKEMTRYLYAETNWDGLPEEEIIRCGGLLLTRCINGEIFDVALTLLQNPSIPITSESQDLRPLYVLAQMPSVFSSGQCLMPSNYESGAESRNFFPAVTGFISIKEIQPSRDLVDKIVEQLEERISLLTESELKQASAYEAMLLAAENGIIELVRSIIRANPDLLWAIDENNRGIISYVIQNHRLDLLDLIKESDEEKMQMISLRVDKFGNNLLHLAAELAPSFLLGRSSSPMVQLQNERLLFKKVERMVHPKCKEAKNADCKKPHEIFRESHEELEKACEKWAKGYASSFSVVGTLIMTITFAAVFTVPGGFDQETGIPILLNKSWFKVFMVTDAISLLMSTTSVLIFVNILSSSLPGSNFMVTLPNQIVVGSYTLFYSVLSMMVAFFAELTLMLRGQRNILIPLAILAYAALAVFNLKLLKPVMDLILIRMKKKGFIGKLVDSIDKFLSA